MPRMAKLALTLLLVPLAGCVPPGAYSEEQGNGVALTYTDAQISNFKEYFDKTTDWPMPEDTDNLVTFGVRICDAVNAAGVEAAKAAYYSNSEGGRDWDLTNDVAISATATLCPEFNGKWVAAPTATPKEK